MRLRNTSLCCWCLKYSQFFYKASKKVKLLKTARKHYKFLKIQNFEKIERLPKKFETFKV